MSKAGIGAIVLIVFTVLKMFGIVFPEGTEVTATEALTALIGIVMLAWGQFDRKDLKFGIIRK